MRKLIAFLLLTFPLVSFAQFKITGKIIDSADKQPIPGATVFLSNASVGAASAADGTFTLDNVRGGQYEIVVSMLRYKSYRAMLLITADIVLPDIEISSKAIGLQQVTIHPDSEWERNYEHFRQKFLGTSGYAEECKIINPEVIDIRFDKTTNKLIASSADYIVIENKALGYRIKYMLNEFEMDYPKSELYFAGEALFENMSGSKSDQRHWEKQRLKAYTGSSMHFLRSVIADNINGQGFEVRRLIRTQNKEINGNFGGSYSEGLVNRPTLTVDSFVRNTDRKGLFAIVYRDCLHISHSGHGPTNIILNKPYALFDNNGIFSDPSSITYEGEWGTSGVAEMLPVDYEPPQK